MTRTHRFILTAVLAWAAILWADAGNAAAPPKPAAGFVLSSGNWVQWPIVGGKAILRLGPVAADGSQTVEGIAVINGEFTFSYWKMTPSSGPSPTPTPTPEPEPTPVPVPTTLKAVVISETKDRTPEQAVVLTSPELRTLFGAGNWREFDPVDAKGNKVTPPDELKPYVARAESSVAKGAKLPQLYIVDTTGKVWWEGLLPGTVAEVKTIVSSIKKGGK